LQLRFKVAEFCGSGRRARDLARLPGVQSIGSLSRL